MKYLYLNITLLLLLSCNSINDDLYVINPDKFEDNEIKLSEIADDISYIPLDNKIPIGTIFRYTIVKDKIFLSVKDVGIVQYDLTGKLIRKIGNLGRGPGEYSQGMYFIVDENSGNVYVSEYGKTKVYSPSGIFQRDIIYEQDMPDVTEPKLFNSFMFCPDYIENGDSKFNWMFIDTLGNMVSRKKNSIPLFQADWVATGGSYIFGGKLFYYNAFNDTIFSISPDFSSKGAYLFGKGDYRRPREKFGITSISKLQSRFYTIFNLQLMFEASHYIFLQYTYLDKNTFAVIDKKTKKTYLSYKSEEIPGSLVKSRPCIPNDLDCGLSLYSLNYVENKEEYFISLIEPFDIRSHILTDEFKKSVPVSPQKKGDFEKLANSLKETDNPVLVLVKLQ